MMNCRPITKEEFLKVVSEDDLTNRGKELAFLKINGFTNKRIAEMYGISLTTVKKHFAHIYEKAWAPGKNRFCWACNKKA